MKRAKLHLQKRCSVILLNRLKWEQIRLDNTNASLEVFKVIKL